MFGLGTVDIPRIVELINNNDSNYCIFSLLMNVDNGTFDQKKAQFIKILKQQISNPAEIRDYFDPQWFIGQLPHS